MKRKARVAYFVSHPIQYQAPLLRCLGNQPDIDLTVFFSSDHSVRGYIDQDFGNVQVKWDVPLLDGYRHEFLPVIRSGTSFSFSRPMNHGIFKALRSQPFDAVWLHGYWSVNSLVVMLAAKLLRIPTLLRGEGTLIDRPRSRMRRAMKRVFFTVIRRFVRAVLPIGSTNKFYWEHYFGVGFPSFDMPYAVDNAFFQQASRSAALTREEFRGQLGLRGGRPVILYASKLMERKRCADLLDAYIRLRPWDDLGRPYLLIVGDGDERTRLEKRVQASGETNVRFLGFQNQSKLGRFFDICDMFVLPSIYEPFGLVINEAMNSARPIIVSDQVGCQPDLVQHGVSGLVFRAGDVEGLTAIMQQLIDNPGESRAMGLRALDRINQWSFAADVEGFRRALDYAIRPDSQT